MGTFLNILSFVGSLGLFLYGMKIMSEGLEKLAGDKMRNVLGAMTRNRFMGVLTGVGVTALIQSSSATTVMVVSFVNAGLTAQKTAWHRDINFSARAQFFPLKPWNITLSTQRSRVGADSLHYVSFDAGTFYHDEHWHAEVEYLHKRYFPNQYVPVHAVDAFLAYTHTIQSRKSNRGKGLALSYLARYDYMSQQELTDAERHRLTTGITLHMVLYRQLAADLRLNYEQYWYAADATPKESEQSKLVAELMLHF